MARISFRIVLDGGQAIGPGKIALLEGIAETGSIAAAGRTMHMSYRRAWTLVGELNAMFRTPLVCAQTGGVRGGGALLTALGRQVVDEYRALASTIGERARERLEALEDAASRRPARRARPKTTR